MPVTRYAYGVPSRISWMQLTRVVQAIEDVDAEELLGRDGGERFPVWGNGCFGSTLLKNSPLRPFATFAGVQRSLLRASEMRACSPRCIVLIGHARNS